MAELALCDRHRVSGLVCRIVPSRPDAVHGRGAQVLGNDNIALHNQLIRGIFQNAIINTVHPPAVETPVAPDPFDPPARADKKKKKKAQASVAAPTGAAAAGREPGKAGGTQRDSISHDIIWLHQQVLDLLVEPDDVV